MPSGTASKAARARKRAAAPVIEDMGKEEPAEGVHEPPPPPDPPEPLEPTNPEEWGGADNRGFVIELPSGNKAMVRRKLDLIVMLKTGQIPNPLAKIVWQWVRGEKQSLAPKEMTEEQISQLDDLLINNAIDMMVQPRCVAPPDDEPRPQNWRPPAGSGSISVYQLTYSDRLYLLSVAQGGATDLERFRAEQDRLVAAAQNGQ